MIVTNTAIDNIDLADRDEEILRLVADYEPVRAGRLREICHWASRNQDIHYRWEKLSERDLITLEEEPDESVPINPKVSMITQRGHNYIGEKIHSEKPPETLEERVTKIEKKYEQLQDSYVTAKKKIINTENRLAELEETYEKDAEKLSQEIRQIRRYLDQESPIKEDIEKIDEDEIIFSDDD